MRGVTAALLIALGLAVPTGASYAQGHTTEDRTVQAGPPLFPGSTFETVVEGPGQPRAVRALPNASVIAGRSDRRVSLSYFAQLSDFQLVDEESPARVEFVDKGPSSAFRPHEAFHPWAVEYSFRQLNAFTAASPHAQAGGARAPMDLGLFTGDQADNQQHNETVWVRQLIEGGSPLTPNSGVADTRPPAERYSQCPPASQAELTARETAGEIPPEPTYMGVQDYQDLGFEAPDYWDPNKGEVYNNFPTWPGLMDRAQSLTFTPTGLRRADGTAVPTYLANGNHDGLVQGNEDSVKAFEDIATGCFKLAGSTSTLPIGGQDPNPNVLLSPGVGFAVRPDEDRRHVDRVELKEIYSSGIQADGHGFGFVDPAELSASGFSATYWSRELKPGMRFISIDTVSEGGVVEESSNGNIDDPQWRWLERELDAAESRGELAIVFGHHPIRSLNADPPDEAAQRCSGTYDASGQYSNPDRHGHDANPGCDLDPRSSSPIHQGDDLRALLSAHRNVIAYVAGHTHENKVLACGHADGCPAGGNWWEINTSATADWSQQSRLVEVMDNRDGTLSIFGTLTDPGGPLAVPPQGTSASGFGNDELVAISRAVAFNDPQAGDGTGEGAGQDQNVELLVDDPRSAAIRGTAGDDVIRGTPGRDLVICGPGDDVVTTGDGDDVIRCGRGNDTVRSGRGNDSVSGGPGRDLLIGGPGHDRLFGQGGRDRIFGQGGSDLLSGGARGDRMRAGSGPDRVQGGGGNDRAAGGGGADVMLGGRGRDRLAGQRGNDVLIGGRGRDRLLGGPGRDRRRQ